MSTLLNFFLPHFFVKEPISEITDVDLLACITKLRQCSNVEVAMKQALKVIADRYDSKRFETYISFHKLYEKNPNILWQRLGFMHCTHQNYLFRVLLVKSGWLTEDQIELGFSLIWYISPHQYLKITLKDGVKIAVDPWNFNLGATYGKYAAGFGVRSL
jgi:hypothetical protein